MVKIRLMRMGKKGSPHYRIIAIQAREKRESRAIEYLGFYNPISKEKKLDKKRIKYWLSVGAQPTQTVAYLLAKEGLMKMPKKTYSKNPGKKKQERQEKKETEEKSEVSKEKKQMKDKKEEVVRDETKAKEEKSKEKSTAEKEEKK